MKTIDSAINKNYSKTLDEQDYDLMSEMNFINEMKNALNGTYYTCHQHRNWEYGLCLNFLLANGAVRILEVGGTGSIFAAAAAWFGMDVTVVDPSVAGARLFSEQDMLLQLGSSRIEFEPVDFFQYQNKKKFDAVVCISTLEHVPDDENFFKRLLGSVKEGGVLFMTVDFHPSGQRFTDAHLRTYNQDRLTSFIEMAKDHGFELCGEDADYSWRGASVYNYTFASLALKRRKKQEVPVVLFVNHKSKQRDGVYQYGKRSANTLKNSKKCQFIYLETDSTEEYLQTIHEQKPKVIIYNTHFYNMPWLNATLVNLTHEKGIFMISLFHDRPMAKGFDYYISMYPQFPDNKIGCSTPRPLFEYENKYPVSEIPIINSFGFNGTNGFINLAKLVNDEFDEAILNFHMPINDFGFGSCQYTEAEACRNVITKSGIQFNVTHTFMSEIELLDFLAKGSLNAFLYHEMKGRGCASTIDFALSVKRPIAITKSHMFRHILDATPSICVEDRSLKQIMASGFAPLETYYEKWRPNHFIKAYENIVESIL